MFDQISAQIKKMLTVALSNNEKAERMTFELAKNDLQSLKVAKIRPNGACLFGALTHQFFGHKIDSDEHERATKQMRMNVVNHISSHYSSFQKELRGRVYAEINPKSIKDMEKEIKVILNDYLPLDHYWGGAETLKAVREIHQVNILILNERGTCQFFYNFKEEYKRTLILAFRLEDKTLVEINLDSYNHYDSVYDISSNEILSIIEILSEREQKKNIQFNETL